MAETCRASAEVKRAYATKLAPQLAKDYGKQKRYSPQQILDSATRAGLDIDYICWGYVLFLDEGVFDALHQSAGEVCDYVAMHTEMGGFLLEAAKSSNWLPGNFDWSLFDITSWSWPDFGDWFDFDVPDID